MGVTRLRILGIGIVCCLLLAGVTSADTIVLSTPSTSGVVGVGDYEDLRIESSFTQNGGFYTYEYWITSNDPLVGADGFEPLDKDISHFILQVSEGFELDEIIIPGTLDSSHDFDEYEVGDWSSSQGNSNPGLPGVLHGIKFDLDEDTGELHLSFDSYRLPILGDFYIKSGNNDGGNYAYNVWRDTGGTRTSSNSIWTPDTQTIVPEPASMTLLGLGIGGLLVRRFRKNI